MELSVRHSKLIDAKTRQALVLKDGVIFNNKYEGDAKAGAVKIRKTGAVTVSDYDKVNGVSLSEGGSEYITVPVNKDKAINEIIDGYNAAAVPDGMVVDRFDEASFAMANRLDIDGAYELVNGGTTLENTTAITSSNVYSSIVDARTALTKAGVPNDGQRYIIVSPDVFALILKSSEFTPASSLGDNVKETGAVGRIAGMLVFESANLGNGVEYVAGHPNYATRVNEWEVPIAVNDLADGKHIGACAVQGRKVYTHKVTNENCIVVKTTNF